ncbi:MAG: ribonuclease HII [Burkholderiaceae bacterium]|jgi:ribonuclease HII|nr:ribonuclease HII [Burkholderiaceae bacterium]
MKPHRPARPRQADLFADAWGGRRVCGADEAGRGPLAGPVVAAAVIFDPRRPIDGLRDSKLLPRARRAELAVAIRGGALAWAVAEASVAEIDRLNILQASLLAMRRAIELLDPPAEAALVDGNRLPRLRIAARAVVGGDASEPVISAASILAKQHRDALMAELDGVFPGYGFAEHAGYPTPRHLQRLRELGPCEVHRRSFAPVRALIDKAGR